MKELDELVELINRLRGPDGCPWDRRQTLATLRPCLREEACEVVAAINALDRENLEEELGDLLFGTLMLCRTAAEEADIGWEGICRGITEKMIRRHPHVFAEVEVSGADEVVVNWEGIKAEEKGHAPAGFFDETWDHLPALARSQKVQKKAARIGFDWKDPHGVVAKIREETAEVEVEIGRGDLKRLNEEIGDLLFSVVNLARFFSIDAETSLHEMVDRWVRRFQKMEQLARARGLELAEAGLDRLDPLWDEVSGRTPPDRE
ncbi:MAG TPA: nucleoside triphosphate pyrophosphohydrolase [bacterium]|nr:nucleoside triphosphate pyrophosphohydrolase [bacterium]